jgi:hypothetical protein
MVFDKKKGEPKPEVKNLKRKRSRAMPSLKSTFIDFQPSPFLGQ